MHKRKTQRKLKSILSLLLSILMLTGAFLSFASCSKKESEKSKDYSSKLGIKKDVRKPKETSREPSQEVTVPTDPEPSETETSTDPSDTVPQDTKAPTDPRTNPQKADENPYFYSAFSMEDDINSCLHFNKGRMVVIKDTAFYVQKGNADNGYASGFSDSEDIFMLKDGTDAKMIASVPVNRVQGNPTTTVTYLVPHEEDLFFFVRSGENTLLMKVETESKNLSTIYTFEGMQGTQNPCIDNDHLYVFSSGFDEISGTFPPIVYDIDLSTGEVKEDHPKFKCAEGAMMCYVFAVSDGYYYIHLDMNDPGEIHRCPIGGVEEELVLLTEPLLGFIDIVGNYLFTDEGEFLHIYDKNNGQLIAELPDMLMRVLNAPLIQWILVRPDFIRYIDETGNVVSYRLDETLEKTVVMEPLDGMKIRSYVEYQDGYLVMLASGQVHKVEKDTSVISADPISTEDQSIEKKNDEWIYQESADFIEIKGYLGTSEKVSVPDVIDGKPVRFVYLTENSKSPITSLTIPEGVTTISLINCPSVTELYLPKTLQNFSYGGFRYTINIKDGATIYYTGSKENWETIVAMSDLKFSEISADTQGTPNLKMEFLDK